MFESKNARYWTWFDHVCQCREMFLHIETWSLSKTTSKTKSFWASSSEFCSHRLATIPLLDKEWKISFDFMATSFKGIRQVLHLTTGGVGSGGGAKYGDRTPAIWTHPTKGFLVSSAVSGKVSYAKWFKALPQPGEWINIEISQVVEVSNIMYSITIGGKKVFSVKNTKPAKFENVKVFSSSTWYHATSGSIRNLLIENVNGGKLTHPSKK